MSQENLIKKPSHDLWRPQPELGMSGTYVEELDEPLDGDAEVYEPKTAGEIIRNMSGRVGYVLAWLLGVPAWILLVVFLIRGH